LISEQASTLLEAIVEATSPPTTTVSEQRAVDLFIRKQYLPSPANYELEQQVNARLGIDLYTYFQAVLSNTIVCGTPTPSTPVHINELEELNPTPQPSKKGSPAAEPAT